jgi:microcystin-dependent protein
MSSPFLAEIRIVGYNFAQRGWAFCNGQILSIQQNTALFSLVGTYYGGNGTSTYALPDLRGRVPVGWGQGPGLADVVIGEQAGVESVALQTSQIPLHGHTLNAGLLNPQNAAQNVAAPTTQAYFGLSGPNQTYSDVATPAVSFNPLALATAGSSIPHENRQPYLACNFVIALQGIYPARN